jgi:hypothetical protein
MSRWKYEDETCPLQGLGNVIKALLIAFLLSFLLCAAFGCSSIRRGDFSVDSFGTDVAIKSAEWHKVDGTCSESLILKGAEKNGTETSHTFANLAMGIVSALAGATSNKGDPAKGAAFGLIGGISLTEAWQTGKDLLRK